MGGTIGDIDDVSRPLRAIARQNDDAAAEQLFAAWHGLGACPGNGLRIQGGGCGMGALGTKLLMR